MPLWRAGLLPAQPQAGNQRAIALRVFPVEIGEETPTLTNQAQQAPARMSIVLMHFEMLGKVTNPAREDGNLHLWRAGITFMNLILGNNLSLLFDW